MTSSENESVPARWAWHHRTLSRLREALLDHRAECSSILREPPSTDSNDLVDVAAEVTERDVVLRERNTDEIELSEVEAALERIRLGTYGVCEETGAPIHDARLRAIPWTRYSIETARRHELDAAARATGGARPSRGR